MQRQEWPSRHEGSRREDASADAGSPPSWSSLEALSERASKLLAEVDALLVKGIDPTTFVAGGVSSPIFRDSKEQGEKNAQ